MKFSAIKGERALDVICELIEPVSNIALDDDAADFFQRVALPEGENVREFIFKRLRTSYPALLGKHKSDIIHIMATIEGVEDREYLAELDTEKLMISLAELLTDPIFRSFFTFARSGNVNTSSVSAQENTGEV